MASLNHAPPRCVTSVGMPPSLNRSVQEGERREERQQGSGTEKKLASVSHTVEGADGEVGSPSRSSGGLTCENLEASSLRPSAVGCWSREGEDRPRDISISTCRTTSKPVKEP